MNDSIATRVLVSVGIGCTVLLASKAMDLYFFKKKMDMIQKKAINDINAAAKKATTNN